MNLQEYKAFFLVVTGILSLLVASPALQRLLVFPQTEFFSELWILGPNHSAENYPFNITRNHGYSVFLGVGNHLGYAAYYLIEVKFRNQTQPAANSSSRTSSSLPSLYNITAFVADKGEWEYPLTFSFDYDLNTTLSRIEFYSLKLNDALLDINNYTATWDPENNGFFGNLFFELWIFNATTRSFQYHERFVSLRFNMTSS